jgi:hypothetical protein
MHSSAGGKNDKHKLVLEITLPISGAATVLAIGLVLYGLHNSGKRKNMKMSTQGQQPARGILPPSRKECPL